MASAPEQAPWILLRGLVREAAHWGDFPERLRCAFPDAPVICADLPGNGAMRDRSSPLHIAGMAEACRGALVAAGVRPPWRLLALSLGGMVATAWAQRHPAEIQALALVNTSMRPFSPFYRRLRPSCYRALVGIAFGGGDAASQEAAVLALVSNDAERRAAAHEQWTGIARERPVRTADKLRQLLAAARFRAAAAPPAAATLVLASAADRLVDSACSHAIARAWNAALAVHPSAGHDLPLDDPEWLIAELARLAPSAAAVRRSVARSAG